MSDIADQVAAYLSAQKPQQEVARAPADPLAPLNGADMAELRRRLSEQRAPQQPYSPLRFYGRFGAMRGEPKGDASAVGWGVGSYALPITRTETLAPYIGAGINHRGDVQPMLGASYMRQF